MPAETRFSSRRSVRRIRTTGPPRGDGYVWPRQLLVHPHSNILRHLITPFRPPPERDQRVDELQRFYISSYRDQYSLAKSLGFADGFDDVLDNYRGHIFLNLNVPQARLLIDVMANEFIGWDMFYIPFLNSFVLHDPNAAMLEIVVDAGLDYVLTPDAKLRIDSLKARIRAQLPGLADLSISKREFSKMRDRLMHRRPRGYFSRWGPRFAAEENRRELPARSREWNQMGDI